MTVNEAQNSVANGQSLKDSEVESAASPPEKLFVQLTVMGGTVSYLRDPREVHDNGKPVYEYVLASNPAIEELIEAAKEALELLELEGYRNTASKRLRTAIIT